jgi:hypothetical protein
MQKSQASCKAVMAIQSSFFFSWVEFYIMKIVATVLDFMSFCKEVSRELKMKVKA